MDVARPCVAHQPADHPYVRHISADHDHGHGHGPRPVRDVWNVDALRAAGVRIVHLHFGYEHLASAELERWLHDLAAARVSLVHTVHDLHNPHLVQQHHYRRLQARIVAVADALLTLTPSAARCIRSTFGRDAEVVAHPHVVPFPEMDRRRHNDAGGRDGVYVHAGMLRPNLDLVLLAGVAEAAGELGGLRVHVRETAPAARRQELEHALGTTPATVDVRPRLSDIEMWDRLGAARLVALPYRWGTHSGLLEAAHDLGTPVVAPRFGGYADQGAAALDATDIAGTMGAAASAPPRIDTCGRREQRRRLAVAHRRIYARLLVGS